MNDAHSNDDYILRMLDVPKLLLGDAAYAAGVSANLLKAWLSREPLVIKLGEHDQMALGKGSARVLTLRRVIQIALTAELVRLAVAPQRAGKLSFIITDVAGNANTLNNILKPTRDDVEPINFEKNNIWTQKDVVLVFDKESNDLLVSHPDESIRDMMDRFGEGGFDNILSCIIINFGAIRQRTIARLVERGRLS